MSSSMNWMFVSFVSRSCFLSMVFCCYSKGARPILRFWYQYCVMLGAEQDHRCPDVEGAEGHSAFRPACHGDGERERQWEGEW